MVVEWKLPRCSSVMSSGSDGLELGSRSLTCPNCRARYPDEGGFFDLHNTALRGEPTAATQEQRLMESELVARLYDRTFRPAFVRLLGGKGASKNAGGIAGEAFIYKNTLGVEDPRRAVARPFLRHRHAHSRPGGRGTR